MVRIGSGVGRRGLLVAAGVTTLSFDALLPLSASDTIPAIRLADGTSLPLPIFGLQIYDDNTAEICTMRALECGFRAFFTSPEAGNQRGFARAISRSGVARGDIFIAGSVLSDDANGYREALKETSRACDESLEALASGGVDSLDMLLLERPAGTCAAIRGQWQEMMKRRGSGVCRSLGVCNFDLADLDCLAGAAYMPQVNQIPYSLALRMPHRQILRGHRERRIALMTWGPLGGPSALIPRSMLDQCAAIGKQYDKTAYQVALRWIVQQGVAFTVHSRVPEHLRSDLAIFDFALTNDEMASLESNSERPALYY